jgi:predicted transglutaminase-like cysteine proteinase
VVHFKLFITILALASLSACASQNLNAIPSPESPTQAILAGASIPSDADFPSLNGTPAKPPMGYIDFCARLPDQCVTSQGTPRQVNLTDDVWNTLQQVNTAFNKAIAPEDDRVHYGIEEYWAIPIDGYGDCEDYVVAKRQALMRLGLPGPALRIAVVFAPHFVRHAVLTIVTDKGNYVLDNLRDEIVTWDKTGYAFIKRQDPASTSGWVSLE